MPHWLQFLNLSIWGQSLSDWALAALAFALTVTLIPLLRRYLRAKAAAYAGEDQPRAIALFAYLVQHTSRVVLWTAALFAAEKCLTLPRQIDRVFGVLIIVGIGLQMGIWILAAVRFAIMRSQPGKDPRLASSFNVLMFTAGLLVWTVLTLLVLENLGVNVTALVAGLGVGGIAIALAMQTVLGDLFASLSIALDRPFAVGDWLRFDDCDGTVERIGIKSTRIRSVTGEQLILSNTDLLKSRIHNLGRMTERRALFSIAISYENSPALLEQVPKLIEAAVRSHPGTIFGYCLLQQIGDAALSYQVYFQVQHREAFDLVLAIDAVNRRILSLFHQAGVQLAHPMHVIHVHDRAAAGAISHALAGEPAGQTR